MIFYMDEPSRNLTITISSGTITKALFILGIFIVLFLLKELVVEQKYSSAELPLLHGM